MASVDSTPVVVEFQDAAIRDFAQLAAQHPDIALVESRGFNAAAYTVQAVFVASAGGAIRSITAVIRAHIDAKKHVTIKAEGVEIRGLSADDAVAILDPLRTTGRMPTDISQSSG